MTEITQEELDRNLNHALERLSVLVRARAEWSDHYAYGLGESMRRMLKNHPVEIQNNFFEVLNDLDFSPAISGWRNGNESRTLHSDFDDDLRTQIDAVRILAKYYKNKLEELSKMLNDLDTNNEFAIHLSQYEKSLVNNVFADVEYSHNEYDKVVELFQSKMKK